jgi:hypothetical protein
VTRADRRLVALARHHGCRPGLARPIIRWARAYGVPISLAFALFEHESGFRKVFGHDPTIYAGAGAVTKARYLAYRALRRAHGNRLMQGVGEGQLTWWETQDRADALGGCWRADANVRVALLTLAARIHEHGEAAGIARYNGAGPAAAAYSRQVRTLARVWHVRLIDERPQP